MNDDGLAARFSIGFYFATRTNINFTASGAVRFFDATATIDNSGGREIRPRNVLHQLFNADVFIFNVSQAAVNHFTQVMRRNVGCHTHGDTGRAVHQQVRNFGRQNFRDLLGAVVVRYEIDGLFFQVS